MPDDWWFLQEQTPTSVTTRFLYDFLFSLTTNRSSYISQCLGVPAACVTEVRDGGAWTSGTAVSLDVKTALTGATQWAMIVPDFMAVKAVLHLRL